ncbi:MAG: DNA-processing protein DprA [Pseudohaliea sp.]
MPGDSLAHCLLLEFCDGLSAAAARALLAAFPDSDTCLAAGPRAWRAAGLPPAACSALAARRRRGPGREERAALERSRRVGASALPFGNAGYPALLRAISDPPPWLYLRGDPALLAGPQLAVVGSRRASALGRRATRELAGDLAQAGLTVTSGLALGIDGCAHRGALDAGGDTVAVMATGIDQVYPRRHRDLAAAIVERGCLVTELPPGAGPRRSHFPRRNRLISGLSLGTLVIEAALPSGTLLTASAAAAQGRDVFAVPWSRFHPGGRGCLQLLRDGAGLVESAADVLLALGWPGLLPPGLLKTGGAAESAAAPGAALSAPARRLLGALDAGERAPDRPALDLGESVEWVLTAAGELELAGLADRGAGGYRRLR